MAQHGTIETTAQAGGGPVSSTTSVNEREPDFSTCIDVRHLVDAEGIALGFRQGMFSIDGDNGEELGGVSTGAGCGTDAIICTWGDEVFLVRGRDLLRVLVGTVDPAAAEKIPS